MSIEDKIEAILFYKGEPVKLEFLQDFLDIERSTLLEALDRLKDKRSNTGLTIVRNEDNVSLGIIPALHKVIERIDEKEIGGDLSKASLETLTIIVYQSPISKSEIDFIRGVNSSYILRNLMVRGLVERKTNPKDNRSFIYKPTIELLSMLGIEETSDIPEYEDVNKKIEEFELDFATDENQ